MAGPERSPALGADLPDVPFKGSRSTRSEYLYLKHPIGDGEVARTLHPTRNLLVDLDAEGRILGVENVGGAIGEDELVEVLRHLRVPQGDRREA